MLKKLALVPLLLLCSAMLVAQTPQQVPPPPLDGQPWDIHSPRGDMGLDIKIEFWFNDGWCDYYTMEICDAQGNVLGVGLIEDCGDGTELDVWSDDSGLWYKWKWKGTHYEKVGGSAAKRTYHPHP